ncbi:hypothetical protein [Massilia sp. TSP1-1-2]|uniref:hypothetical protein n=1 Tax=Massilia sp. TSP1-1-2 TaxID=2804649 RepID=UPI003CEC998B
MNFKRILDRLRDAASAQPVSDEHRSMANGRRTVNRADLAELLNHHDRLDAAARLGYPPHIDALVDAAAIALCYLPPGQAAERLRQAAHNARPSK